MERKIDDGDVIIYLGDWVVSSHQDTSGFSGDVMEARTLY